MAVADIAYMELVLESRRSKFYWWRYIYAAWLLLWFSCLYLSYWAYTAWLAQPWFAQVTGERLVGDETYQFAAEFLSLLLWQQPVLLIVATPPLAAGAIADEKERGTLQYLICAGVTSMEIVLGKLLARLVMLSSIFMAGIPWLFVTAGFLGLGFGAVLAILLPIAAMAFALAAASLLASVWSKRSRDAILYLYLVLAVLLVLDVAVLNLASPAGAAAVSAGTSGSGQSWADNLAAFVRLYEPVQILLLALEEAPGIVILEQALLRSAAWVVPGVLCLALAAARLRPAYARQLEGLGRRRLALLLWARPALQEDPIRWKERYVAGLAPLPVLRYLPQWVAIVLVFLVSSMAAVGCLLASLTPYSGAETRNYLSLAALFFNLHTDPILFTTWLMALTSVAALAFSLVVGIRCSGAITGEREKHTWEALLMTPLETPSLVRAKLWGIVGATYPYLIAYALPLGVVSMLVGPAALVMLLIALLATWLGMFYAGATGLWCSARSTSSWRSLLATLAWAYLGGFLVLIALSPLLLTVWSFLVLLMLPLEWLLWGTTTGGWFVGWPSFLLAGHVMVALTFLAASWFFLVEAEKRVADYDRARHWTRELQRPGGTAPRRQKLAGKSSVAQERANVLSRPPTELGK